LHDVIACCFVSLGAKACATLCQSSRKFVPKAAQRNLKAAQRNSTFQRQRKAAEMHDAAPQLFTWQKTGVFSRFSNESASQKYS
jgi:hypothetical protein